VAALAAVYPVVRAFYRVEISYNEGWNVYNASALAHHQLLFPRAYGWTTVNYPMLSFAIVAGLHRFTHNYLFTARALSLLGTLACAVTAGCIVRRLTSSRRAGWIAGAYCIAIFCAAADFYVGEDDPEMLALAFFMGGLLLYVARRDSLLSLIGVAALFVVGGSIKHDPLAFAAAVLIDLALVSWRRALWFCLWGAGFVATSVWLNLRFGGPGFLLQLAVPRTFSGTKGLAQAGSVYGPLLLPLGLAVYAAMKELKDQRVRVLALLLFAGLGLGVLFAGGTGVSVNAHFTALLAIVMLSVIGLVRIGRGEWRWAGPRVQRFAAAALLLWIVIPLIVCKTWNPVGELRDTAAGQRLFDQDVALLRAQSGPALCESLLRCYFAGKPYDYDPFNATRLIAFHKLDDAVVANGLRQHWYGAVQLDVPRGDSFPDRFDARIAASIEQSYRPVLVHDGAAIYVPR
jgi:hypothetical protein